MNNKFISLNEFENCSMASLKIQDFVDAWPEPGSTVLVINSSVREIQDNGFYVNVVSRPPEYPLHSSSDDDCLTLVFELIDYYIELPNRDDLENMKHIILGEFDEIIKNRSSAHMKKFYQYTLVKSNLRRKEWLWMPLPKKYEKFLE